LQVIALWRFNGKSRRIGLPGSPSGFRSWACWHEETRPSALHVPSGGNLIVFLCGANRRRMTVTYGGLRWITLDNGGGTHPDGQSRRKAALKPQVNTDAAKGQLAPNRTQSHQIAPQKSFSRK
jgi:hypothetical protein